MFGGDILSKQRGYVGTWISAKIQDRADGSEEGKVYTVSVVLVRLKDRLCFGVYVTPRQDTVATFGRRTNSLHARKRRPCLILHVALPRMPNTVSSKDKLGIAL
jgi:hypothetical protein